MIRMLQELSEPGGLKNEDLVWHSDFAAMVLDGSTTLKNSEYDGFWFTRTFARSFESALEEGLSLPEAVNKALAETCRVLEGAAGTYPSASGIFLKQTGETAELLTIGDCTGLVFLKNGSRIRILDDTVKRLDQSVLDRCALLHKETGQTIAELVKTEEIRALLVKNRGKMNMPGGYRILSVHMTPCRTEEVICLPVKEISRVVLFSDGFDEVQEHFADPEVSLNELYRLLREREAADPDFECMPRFKPGDDASALIAEFTL